MSPKRGRKRGGKSPRQKAGDPTPASSPSPPQKSPPPPKALTESRDENLWLVGKIGRAVGLRGEFTLHLASNDPDDLMRLAEARIILAAPDVDPAEGLPCEWEGIRWQGGRAVCAISHILDRTDAEQHVHWQLWVDRRDLPPLEEGRYWIDDLIGCEVHHIKTEHTEAFHIGKVVQVVSGAAQDQLEVDTGSSKKALIPHVAEFIVTVSIPNRRIEVDLPEGLLDG